MFFILALPRSRTKWLSEFLTCRSVRCHHERIAQCQSIDELDTLGHDGTADTVGLPLWRQLYARYPFARYVLVRRDPDAVDASLRRHGLYVDVPALGRIMDDACAALPAIVVEYERMNESLQRIWSHCRNDPMPYGREAMRHQIIADDPNDMIARIDAPRLARMVCQTLTRH